MKKYILELSKKFISIKSDPENKKELEKILTIAIKELKNFSIKIFESKGVKSALVFNSKNLPKKFKVLLNCHLDVIPGKDFQYKPRIKKGKLYGVGAMDMKANAACAISVFKEIANKVNYNLGIQLVTDEETGGFNGTKYQIEKGVCADFVIATEPTKLNIANKAKGIIWLKIYSKGKTAHGAYPWKGKNAIWQMYKFLKKVYKIYPVPSKKEWVSTINLSKIETKNNSFNKIPDECTAWLDIRYTHEDKNKILTNIKSILPRNFEMEIILNEPEMYTNEDNHYIKKLKEVAEKILEREVKLYGAYGSSDVRHFTNSGYHGVEFGPYGQGIGTDDEWVSIISLEKYYKILKTFLTSIN